MFGNKRGSIELWAIVITLVIILAVPAIRYFGMASGKAKLSGLGNDHSVEMYSGGKLVREWTSDGKVGNESNSDGYFFMDKESRKLIEVSGDVVVTRLD